MTKTLHKQAIARVVDRAALTGGLPPEIAAMCTDLVAAVDANQGGIPARTEALVSAAWASTARVAAAAEKPGQVKAAITALKAVALLEAQLGMTPVADTPAEPAASDEPETAPGALTDTEPESVETAYSDGYASTGTSGGSGW